jgi:hypothetical protein
MSEQSIYLFVNNNQVIIVNISLFNTNYIIAFKRLQLTRYAFVDSYQSLNSD